MRTPAKQMEARMELTPFRRRVNNNNVTPVAAPDNRAEAVEEDERTSRRKSYVLLRKSMTASPAAALSSFISEHALEDHLRVCTKLFVENKITTKNAWQLDIIDIIRQIATTKDTSNVFQIAGTSLDISAKVYSCRVDDVHAKGLQLAGTMAKVNVEANNDEENHSDGDENRDDAAKKRRKAKRKKMTGERKATIDYEKKYLLKELPQIASVFSSTKEDSELSATDNLLTMKIRQNAATHQFDLLNKQNHWITNPDVILDNESKDIEYPELDDMFNTIISKISEPTLCRPFQDFVFGEWDPDHEDQILLGEKSKIDDVVLAEDGLPIVELDGSIHDIFIDEPHDDASAGDHSDEEFAEQVERFGPLQPISENVLRDYGEENDYGFNILLKSSSGATMNKLWAGPSYWKLKIVRPSLARFSGKVEQQVMKNTRKAAKENIRQIDFSDPETFRQPDNYEKLSIKEKKVSGNYKIHFPLVDFYDLVCEKKQLKNVGVKPLLVARTAATVKSNESGEADEIPPYNYENANDSLYCSQTSINDHGADDNDDIHHTMEEAIAAAAQQNFQDDNLVEVPELVPTSTVTYAQRAKKMDMKKLKSAVWWCLTKGVEGEGNENVVPISFQDLYKTVPSRLSDNMKSELSCALVFSALLHLCNEMNLLLKQNRNENCRDNTDFIITKAF